MKFFEAVRAAAGLTAPVFSSSPGSPFSGEVALYSKSDGLLYMKTSAGVESVIGGDGTWRVIGGSGQPTFNSPWSHYGTPFQDVRFRRDGNVVRLDGLAKTTTGAVGTIFTLPAGFRPGGNQNLYNGNGTAISGPASTGTAHTHTLNSQTARISITSDGVVALSGTTLSVNSHVSFSGITFIAEN